MRKSDTIIDANSALGGSTPGALCGHQKQHRFRGKTTPIYKVCSLPVLGHYEDTNGREVEFLPIYLYMKKDTSNNEVHF